MDTSRTSSLEHQYIDKQRSASREHGRYNSRLLTENEVYLRDPVDAGQILCFGSSRG